MHVANQVAQLCVGSRASNQVHLSDCLTNYLIANIIADVQRLERGLQLLHIICAVRDEEFTENAVESRAQVEVQPTPARSKLDHLQSKRQFLLKVKVESPQFTSTPPRSVQLDPAWVAGSAPSGVAVRPSWETMMVRRRMINDHHHDDDDDDRDDEDDDENDIMMMMTIDYDETA